MRTHGIQTTEISVFSCVTHIKRMLIKTMRNAVRVLKLNIRSVRDRNNGRNIGKIPKEILLVSF